MKTLGSTPAVVYWKPFKPDGIDEKLFSHGKYDFFSLGKVSYKQFREFLDSLTEENNTWKLDKQGHSNDYDWYRKMSVYSIGTFVTLYNDKIVALYSAAYYMRYNCNIQWLEDKKKSSTNALEWTYSYVVKKEHQQQGLGTKGLKTFIDLKTTQAFYGALTKSGSSIRIDVVIHTARTHLSNLGSRLLLKNLGFTPLEKKKKRIHYMLNVARNGKIFFDTRQNKEYDEDLEDKEMKIQFIICGWHMNRENLIDGLYELKEQNKDYIDVFWSCHRKPTEEIKDKFECKEFFNGGEECGAYDQAVEYLNLSDNTVCFFLHDDLIIKDFSFINICLEILNEGYVVVGNGRDYTENLDPFKKSEIGITEEFDGAYFKDYVKEENQYMFDKQMSIVKVRPSFICMKYKDVKAMNGFEPRIEAYTPPLVKKDEWCENDEPHYRGTKGLGSFGNLFPALVSYKMNKVFGQEKITYLSNNYVDSDYIYECQRGDVSDMHPMS